ncbi:MAG TPA: DUF3300 domain-containing protein [Candidatus Angelobacter sp.]
MKRTLAILLIISLSSIVPAHAIAPPQYEADLYFSAEQLENLVAPVALYPDPLLAQVLLAATFPDQIDEAARELRAYGSGYNVDSATWDVSVKSVAHYPTVLSMMADKLDWTTALGQAYVYQSTDVMEAVQRLRRQARSAGYLVTTPEQEIVETSGFIYIYPAHPRYIYVPRYDPAIIFVARPVVHAGPVIWFSIGFLIGAWLNHDCDWGHHRVYYHGWGPGPVWIERSRPHVRITNVYVNQVYTNVVINRRVTDRRVNYGALNRYNSIHRDVDYSHVRREAGARPAPAPPPPRRDNKIIRRNIDPNDPRIDANRGRGQFPQPQARQPEPQRPEARRPETPQPPVRQPEAPRPEARRPETQRPTAEATRPAQMPRQPEAPRPEARRPETRPVAERTLPAQVPKTTAPQPQPQQRQPVAQRPPESVFRGGGSRTIDPHSASERGQASRQQQARPAPQAKPAPQQQKPPQARGQQGQPRERRR